MRIDNEIISQELTRSGASKRSESAPTSFRDVLAQAVGDDPAPTAGAASAPTKVEAAPRVADTQLWQDLNGLLDSLEGYAQALGDPTRTLKDVAPLAEGLQSRADAVEGRLGASGQDTLAELARQAVAQARVEVIKFHRGDYI